MKKRYSETTKQILSYLALGCAITIVGILSPHTITNIARVLIKNRKLFKKEIEAWKITQILKRLEKNRVIIVHEKKFGEYTVELTDKGKRKMQEIRFEDLKIEKPAKWDKRWRMVIFDVPEGLRTGRDALREKLQKLGFFLIQKSVWVLPWPCEKEVLFLCELFDVLPFVNILTVEKLYNDVKVRQFFHLV